MQSDSTHLLPNGKNRRLGFFSGIPVLFLLFFSGQGCIPYLYHLGKEQAKILLQRKAIPEVLADPEIPETTKTKLKEVEKIRDFGIQKLALSPEGGFKSFVQLDRPAIGWHVSACHPLKFESYTWWFPIAGRVPYKGYFSLEKAKEEEQNLKEQGFDTRIRITAGYSTLGWFEDPLFSSQLYEDPGDLASIVIHEMAHATVYFPGDSLFNESYASFVEEEGSDEYVLKIGGPKLLEERKRSEEETKLYKNLILETANLLKNAYSEGGSENILKAKKSEIISDFRKRLIQTKWTKINSKKLSEKDWNNEDFIGMLRYNSGTQYFKKRFQEVGRDFFKFHEEMRKLKVKTVEERKALLEEK
ncbi:aminopeptidase [Leptospira licerasiae]|uniref:aminopeptidase n=1 Tax=Leptospira licerasiae TaxID=447106 RepID=UPI003019DCAB